MVKSVRPSMAASEAACATVSTHSQYATAQSPRPLHLQQHSPIHSLSVSDLERCSITLLSQTLGAQDGQEFLDQRQHVALANASTHHTCIQSEVRGGG